MREQSAKRAMNIAVVAVGMVSLLTLGRGTAHAKESETPPDLSGTWSLNESKSQTLQQKMEQMRSRGPRMGGGPGMGGGMGGGRHGGWGGGEGWHGGPNGPGGAEGPGTPGESGERGRPGGPGGRNPAMRFLAHPPLLMQVEQNDSAVFLSERDTTLMTLLLNGEPQGSAEGPATLNAHWKGRRLEAEGQGPRGGKLSESYELGKDGKQLIVTGRVERPYGPAVELKLVYDRHEGD